jgi:hypothetical protein
VCFASSVQREDRVVEILEMERTGYMFVDGR